MEYGEILKSVQHHIETFFQSRKGEELAYHNQEHIEAVVAAVMKMAGHYQLDEQKSFIVLTAAWFHDIGHYLGDGSEHELKGAAAAEIFLKAYGIEPDTIIEVKKCIMATQMPQRPNTLCEQILCDADLFHLGTEDFFEADKKLRKEYEASTNRKLDKREWRINTIAFLEAHHFHTTYCQALLNAKKRDNLERLKKKQHTKELILGGGANQVIANLKEASKESVKKPVRGIETMFRVASSNHQRLSDMADSKSHIMISVNSIIISVVIGMVIRKLETTQALIIPTMLLIGGSVIAVIFSVLATRPKIPNGYFSADQLEKKSVNLLFFGNFYKMDFDHYYDGMKRVMSDSEFLYASLIKDIHSQGIVLGNKYRLLRISYTIFMYTLIISVVAFAITIAFFE